MKVTRVVKVGKLKIGGANPVRIKGMLKTPTDKINLLIKEAVKLQRQGAEILRVAVQKEKDAKLAKILKKHISVPIAADIHFKAKLAFLSIKEGFDQIRLNPLNITAKKDIKDIAKLAGDNKVPIRVGINSGGFKKNGIASGKMAEQMVKKCSDYIEILESQNFFDIIVSLKAANIESTLAANKLFSGRFNYPLHLGITAAGPYLEGITKSSAGLGIILNEGIGDIIRVSITGESGLEIKVAKYITQFLGLRNFGPEIISCPACSRCKVNLYKIAENFRKEIDKINCKKAVKVAIMGCVVNGPGEASQADLGAAFGLKDAVLFSKGRIFKKAGEDKIIHCLIQEVKKYG